MNIKLKEWFLVVIRYGRMLQTSFNLLCVLFHKVRIQDLLQCFLDSFCVRFRRQRCCCAAVLLLHVVHVLHRLLVAVQHEQHRCQDLVHALPIAHGRLFARVAEQHVHHQRLDGIAPIEIDAGKRAHHVLPNDAVQFLVAKVLVPGGLLRLRQRIIGDWCVDAFGGGCRRRFFCAARQTAAVARRRIRVPFLLDVLVHGPMDAPLLQPIMLVAAQHVQQDRPADAAEFRHLHVAGARDLPQSHEPHVLADGGQVVPFQAGGV